MGNIEENKNCCAEYLHVYQFYFMLYTNVWYKFNTVALSDFFIGSLN